MKRIYLYIILLLAGLNTTITAQTKKPLRVLLIGNSFSQNASRYLPKIAAEIGDSIQFGHAEMGGCSLQRHWDSVLVNRVDSTRGKGYGGKSLKQLLAMGKWDVVTLQQYSLLSADSSTYSPYIQNLYELVKQYQPNAEILLHQTWAYRADAENFGYVNGKKRAKNQPEMWEKSRAAYQAIAQQLKLRIIPSGDAFYAVSTDSVWQFRKDQHFDSITIQLPADTNSINVGYSRTKEGNLKFDPNHANEAGCYLAGLVWYACLFGKDPRSITYKPAEVPDAFAVFLKETAAKTVKAKPIK